jgi:lipopolysaccharide/colanic/teichoic acid biosynthesis glycosyltransferase
MEMTAPMGVRSENKLKAGRTAPPRQVDRSPMHGSMAMKRVIDVSSAALGLIALSPLLLFCMLWIKAVDGGPVFYHQWRVGRDGWLFRICKFRTMGTQAERDGAQLASSGDARVLPGCRWMRKSHVDELPQLLNILLGQMSLVGPRPERPEILEELRADLPHIDRRLAAVPGLTGLAQVRNGYSNDLKGMRRKLAYDLKYLRQRGVMTDIKLLLQTVPKLWDHAAC